MTLIVKKYGGTSVGTPERIRAVAASLKAAAEAGERVVVVVSAMSGETNRLVALAREMQPAVVDVRELDVLLATGEQQSIALVSMALQDLGIDAASVTGRQAGIHTIGSHTRGRILRMDPSLMRKLLDEGKPLVAAGFQG